MSGTWRLALNIASVNIGWSACVLGAAWNVEFTGPIVVTGLVALHLALMSHPARELILLAAVTCVGTLVDSTLSAFGLLRFDGQLMSWIPLPLWMIALWMNFGTTLNTALRFLSSRLLLASALGGVGGLAAYYGGVRLGALAFHPNTWPSALAIFVEWAVLTPGLVKLADWSRRARITNDVHAAAKPVSEGVS